MTAGLHWRGTMSIAKALTATPTPVCRDGRPDTASPWSIHESNLTFGCLYVSAALCQIGFTSPSPSLTSVPVSVSHPRRRHEHPDGLQLARAARAGPDHRVRQRAHAAGHAERTAASGDGGQGKPGGRGAARGPGAYEQRPLACLTCPAYAGSTRSWGYLCVVT